MTKLNGLLTAPIQYEKLDNFIKDLLAEDDLFLTAPVDSGTIPWQAVDVATSGVSGVTTGPLDPLDWLPDGPTGPTGTAVIPVVSSYSAGPSPIGTRGYGHPHAGCLVPTCQPRSILTFGRYTLVAGQRCTDQAIWIGLKVDGQLQESYLSFPPDKRGFAEWQVVLTLIGLMAQAPPEPQPETIPGPVRAIDLDG